MKKTGNSMSKKDKHIKTEINNVKKKENDFEGTNHSKLKILNEDSNREDIELAIPSVPEPPKQKERLSINSPDLTPDVLARIKKVESSEMKVVLVNCERCKAVIPIPVPKKVVIESELPIVPISFVHKNLENEDQHCITIHLDHDFDIRRQRLSDVVLSID
jgi:hypothetical protein